MECKGPQFTATQYLGGGTFGRCYIAEQAVDILEACRDGAHR